MQIFKKIAEIILSIVLIITYFWFIYLLNDFGFFDNKKLLLLAIISFIFLIFIILGIKRIKNNIIRIVLDVLILIIITINVIGISYLNSTLGFLSNLDKEKDTYEYYYIMALKSSGYKKIDELKNKVIGSVDGLSEKVTNEIKIKYESKVYTKAESLLENLYDNNLDAIIISDIEEYFLEEQDEDFSKKMNVIYKIKLKKNNEVDTVSKDITKEPFVLYISGIDTGGSISKVSRSDVNIVVTVNPNTNQVLLTTIPRDYYVRLHGTAGLKDKLTHAGIYGINMSITTIEDLLDMNIDYYVRVNFDTVIHLVNEIGGIQIYSDQNLSFCNIKQGYNNVDGQCALRFARERKSYATGDRHRGENQEEVIRAIISKLESSPSTLTKYNTILRNLEGDFETNVPSSTIKSFIRLQIKDMPKWSVKNANLNGYDSSNYTYSGGKRKLYVMEPDVILLEKTKIIIQEVLEGKDFNEIPM